MSGRLCAVHYLRGGLHRGDDRQHAGVAPVLGKRLHTEHAGYLPQDLDGNLVENPILSLIETLSIAWFTLEYLLRFAGAPEKGKFLKDAMNIIDVLSIFPFFLDLLVLNRADPEVGMAKP